MALKKERIKLDLVKMKRTRHRDKNSAEDIDVWLTEQVKAGRSISELANEKGVPYLNIYNRVRKLKLTTRKNPYKTYDVPPDWLKEQLLSGKTIHYLCCVLNTNYETMRRLLKKHGLYELAMSQYKKRLRTKTYDINKNVFIEYITDCYKISSTIFKDNTVGFSEQQLEYLKSIKDELIPENDLKKVILKSKGIFKVSDTELLKKSLTFIESKKLDSEELQKKLKLDDNTYKSYLKKYQLRRLMQTNDKSKDNEDLVSLVKEKIKSGMSVQKIADELGQKQHILSYFVRKYKLNSEELMGTRKRPSKRKGQKNHLKMS